MFRAEAYGFGEQELYRLGVTENYLVTDQDEQFG